MRERHGVCLVIGFIHANVDKGLGDLAVTGTSGLQRFDRNVLDSPYPKSIILRAFCGTCMREIAIHLLSALVARRNEFGSSHVVCSQ